MYLKNRLKLRILWRLWIKTEFDNLEAIVKFVKHALKKCKIKNIKRKRNMPQTLKTLLKNVGPPLSIGKRRTSLRRWMSNITYKEK